MDHMTCCGAPVLMRPFQCVHAYDIWRMTDEQRRLVFGQDALCRRCGGRGSYWRDSVLIEKECAACAGTGIQGLRAEEPEQPTARTANKQRQRDRRAI